MNKLFLVLSVLLLSCAGIQGPFLQSLDPRAEAGLLGVCWEPNGLANFIIDCPEREVLHWPTASIPLGVSVDTVAIDRFNAQFECPLLEFNPEDPDVFVVLNAPTEGLPPGGYTVHGRLHGRHFSFVETHLLGEESPDGLITARVLIHEFGHVLGLAHDPFISSIMFPYYNDPPGTSEDPLPRSFTHVDKHILNSLYCN